MSINWFPGHMHKATKEMKALLPNIDVVIEVLDARIPYSSQNPVIESLRGNTPCIKLLNKEDLADPLLTKQWMDYFEQDTSVRTLAIHAKQRKRIQALDDLCRSLVPKKSGQQVRIIKAMVVGVPNVGKSTIINILMDRNITKTGNEPAVTKGQQRLNYQDDITLFDTPGVLWPKFYNEDSAYRLAITGAIKNTAISFDDIGFYAIEYLLKAYPELLMKRYALKTVPHDAVSFFEDLGRRLKFFTASNLVDYHRLGEMVINDIRKVNIGRISFETPAMAEQEKVHAAQAQIDREQKIKARKARRGKNKQR